MSDRWAALKRRIEHMGDPFDPAGTMDKRKAWLTEIVDDIEKRIPEQKDTGRRKGDYIPTKRARFCNQADAMGNGCSDSWWIGGNYGGSLCRNPAHHDAPAPEKNYE